MKKVILLSSLIMGVGLVSFAQGKKKSKKEKEGEVKVIMVNSENGELSRTEKTYSLKDKKELEKLLKEKGIDFSFDEKEGVQLRIDGDGENMEKRVIVKTTSEDGTQINTENYVKVIAIKDGENTGDRDVDVIIKQMSDGDKNEFVYKMVNKFITDEEGDIEIDLESSLEGKTMVFIRKESKQTTKTDLPESITEVFDGDVSLKNLNLFPNPSNGNFKMKFTAEKPDNFDLTITDSKGAVIYEKSLQNFQGEFNEDFDLSKYDAGVYFFNLSSKAQTLSKQIIVQ